MADKLRTAAGDTGEVPMFPPPIRVPIDEGTPDDVLSPDGAEMPTTLPPMTPPEPVAPRPTEPPEGVEIGYADFGRLYVRRVLNRDRVLRVIDDLLGDRIELGPIGAGPGRALASVKVLGRFGPTSGYEVPADLLTYRVDLPIAVTFDVEHPLDKLTFNADVVVPLTLTVHTEAPVRVRMELTVPDADQVVIAIKPSTRRGAVFQKMTGLESELRRFLIKVVRTELDKPYVRRAMHLDMEELIDGAWGALSAQFLPAGPEDRKF